jgi:drug/metabolite transporter (DMT)-like permease
MATFNVFLTICSFGAFSLAGVGICKRYATKLASPLQVGSLMFGLSTGMLAVFYFCCWGLSWPQHLLPKFWQAVVIGTIVNAAIQWLNLKAASLDAGEVSLTAPLQAMTPGLITILALTLGELPGKVGCVGVFCMMSGSYIMTFPKNPERWVDYFGPFARLRILFNWRYVAPAERNKAIVVVMALGSAALGTVGLLCDGLYARRGVDLQGLILASGSLTLGLTLIYTVWALATREACLPIAIFKVRLELLPRLHKLKVSFSVVIILLSFFWVAHVLTVHTQFNETFVAYVGTLKRFSILYSVLLGRLVFGEGDFKKRIWAAGLIIIGAVLISLDGLPQRLTDHVEFLGL